MHISELSRAVSEERRLVAYHLKALEEPGFVKSKYQISEQQNSKGKAIRMCTVPIKWRK
jgi:DNA-binding transcriptional ArsR family regulator